MPNFSHTPKKLTKEAVVDIRTNYVKRKTGFTVPAFAAKYKVSKQTVISVLNGNTWSHVPSTAVITASSPKTP